jgi:hypothetical protein
MIPGKDTDELFRSLTALEKFALLIPKQIKAGFMKDEYWIICSRLFMIANHPSLRIRGLQLVLLYLKLAGKSEPFVQLYQSAIYLEPFLAFESQSPSESSPCVGKNETSSLAQQLREFELKAKQPKRRERSNTHVIEVWSSSCKITRNSFSQMFKKISLPQTAILQMKQMRSP